MAARRFLVSGRVQGVGFRWFTRARARALGVAGSVRNLPDGRVEVVAKGTVRELADLEAFLIGGPASSIVTNVEISEIPDEGDGLVRPFSIA